MVQLKGSKDSTSSTVCAGTSGRETDHSFSCTDASVERVVPGVYLLTNGKVVTNTALKLPGVRADIA